MPKKHQPYAAFLFGALLWPLASHAVLPDPEPVPAKPKAAKKKPVKRQAPVAGGGEASERTESDVPLDETLAWIAAKIAENKLRIGGNHDIVYSRPSLAGCTITLKYHDTWVENNIPLYTEHTGTGNLGDINVGLLDIKESDGAFWVYEKSDGESFTYVQHGKTATGAMMDFDYTGSFLIMFGNRDIAQRFLKALAHAATLCSHPQGSEPRQADEPF